MVREAVVNAGDLVEGRYRIVKKLGAGGMGTVFLAEHALIKRRVAIKILHGDLATDAHVVERFMNEARAAGTLGHPNIVESTDMGFTHDHVPYIVYEYLEGTLLTDEIYRVGGLPVRRAVWIAAQIASALEAAHRAGIIHRDLKSDNVFLTDKDDALDHVKVLDFGVSRFLEVEDHPNLVVGTPEFMAPEQITTPDQVDKRTDIYALGVILYEMLTARRPFSAGDDAQLLMHHVCTKAPPPLLRNEVPDGLSSLVIDRLLAKDPAERPQTMGDVQAALEQFMTRGDGTPLPRRRSTPSVVMRPVLAEAAETGPHVPRPASRSTPWPLDTLDTPIAVGQVSLPVVPPAKKPYALYAIAGAGVVIGMIGLVVGTRGGDAPAPAPVVQQVAAASTMPAPRPAAPEPIEVRFDADVANAHVVFRRRVHPAPVKLEISATNIVELVEVSAPGYKTTRYWLTFDRPTHLEAHLVKGKGSVEATEEETLAALGEVIVVSDRSPLSAAAASVGMAKTVERQAAQSAEPASPQVAMAPRKIGRAAADAEPVAEPAPESVVAEPSVEPPAEPALAPQPMPAAEAEPVGEPVPAAEAEPVGEPVPEAEAEPVAEPVSAKAEPPPTEPARPAIDRATVSHVIAAHRPEVLACFAQGKKKNPAMKGTLELQLQVAPTGAVHRIQVASTLHDPFVAGCVARAANRWRFPARSGDELASVAYPFTIN